MLFICHSDNDYKCVWYDDCGCNSHMTRKAEHFINLDKSAKSHVKVGDGFVQEIHGKGTIQMNISGMKTIVLYIPGLDSYRFSIGQFLNDGYSIVF